MRKNILTLLIMTILSILLPGIVTLVVVKACGTGIPEINVPVTEPMVIVRYEEGQVKLDVSDYLVYVLGDIYEEGMEEEYLKCRCVMARTVVYKTAGDKSYVDSRYINEQYLTQKKFLEKFGSDAENKMEYFKQIIKSTGDEKIYCKEKLAEPLFHMISAGKTQDGTCICDCLYPVTCDYDKEAQDYECVRLFQTEELVQKLGSDTFTILMRNDSGYVEHIKVGNEVISGELFAAKLSLNSSAFYISEDESGISITTYGLGSGYGMSIYSARRMASENSNYKDILAFFYKNIEIRQ